MFRLSSKEIEILKKLDSPSRIQDFVNKLEINFEKNGETLMSPRRVLRERKAHCIEAAFLAWLAFKINKKKAWIVDLKADRDYDHVICVFEKNNKLGCISKSNHAAHRYREPVYRDLRELVMSIFHEYIDEKGRKTLRSFSEPLDLEVFGENWITEEKDLWFMDNALDSIKHFDILEKNQKLRKADKIEIKAGNIVEWKQ